MGSINPENSQQVPIIGQFVKKHSWGEDYPFDAAAFLAKADYIAVAYLAESSPLLVGCACITRHQGCPDNYDDRNSWFCCWVVHEHYRGKGIGTRIYRDAIAHARETIRTVDRALYASTDSAKTAMLLGKMPRPDRFWRRSDGHWASVRDGQNEDGSSMKVWKLAL